MTIRNRNNPDPSLSLIVRILPVLLLWHANAQNDTCPNSDLSSAADQNNSIALADGSLAGGQLTNATLEALRSQSSFYTSQLDELAYEANFHPSQAFRDKFQSVSLIPKFYPNIIGCACNSTCVNVACCDAPEGNVTALCEGTLSDLHTNATTNSTPATNSTTTDTTSVNNPALAGIGPSNLSQGSPNSNNAILASLSSPNPASASSIPAPSATSSSSTSSSSNDHCPIGNICTSWWGCGDPKYCYCLQLNTNALFFHCSPRHQRNPKRDTTISTRQQKRGTLGKGQERRRLGGWESSRVFRRQDDVTPVGPTAFDVPEVVLEDAGPIPCNCTYVSPGCRKQPREGYIHEPPGRNLGMVKLPDNYCCNRNTGKAQEGRNASISDSSCRDS